MAKIITILELLMLPKNFNKQINNYFNSDEFQCKCSYKDCDTTLLHPWTIESITESRKELGRPIHINSAHRCQRHNADVGGSPTSSHMKGLAADISKDGDPEQQNRILNKYFDVVIEYDTFFHCHNNSKPEVHLH